MKSKLTKLFACILVVSLLCALFSGCSKRESSPVDTIEKLERAINHVDIQALLGCLDSSWAGQLRKILALTLGSGNISVEDFFSAVQFALPIVPLASRGAIGFKELPRIELTPDQVEQDGTGAQVSLSGTLQLAGSESAFSARVQMRLEDGKWVICGIQ